MKMKIIIEKSTNIVKWGFDDSIDIQTLNDRIICGEITILDMNSENAEVIEAHEPPTKMFHNLYEWKNSDWKLLWSVQKKVSEISKTCSKLSLADPTGSEEEWNDYINKIDLIQDELLININPFYVEWPKKP